MITRRNLVKRFRKYRLQYRWNAVCKSQGACRVGGHSRDEAQPQRSSSNGVSNPNVWPCVDDDDTPRRAVVRGRSTPARQIARGRSRHPGRVKAGPPTTALKSEPFRSPLPAEGGGGPKSQPGRGATGLAGTSSTPSPETRRTFCYLCIQGARQRPRFTLRCSR